MDTEQLIRSLAVDNGSHASPIWFSLTQSLLVAVPVTSLLFFLVLGFRSDIAIAIHNPFFGLKFAVTTTLAISTLVLGLHLARPEATLGCRAWPLLIPIGLLAAGIVGEMMLPQGLSALTRLVGTNSRICLAAIPLMSLPLLTATLAGLRQGATSHPARTGAVAGLFSAGLAATFYASNCTDDSPLFVITWYSLAGAIVASLGALAGNKVLRF
ncbi:DUF1109 domain-containing protein [Bradyrhizobium sp. Ash2021]|uniref:DUF1109 domain-containing protein n=1 Tax=Bradyrhizobium sp. Ash2021 TaxID=2954771 RepID=UPI002815FAB4|nr:DUF1109 domain-containing protein [Bradyrhizobium sp. Ash2021]WMT75979.1 DUF1109 domain-containing protein [Bradyrhizobium sp. Ash2021]